MATESPGEAHAGDGLDLESNDTAGGGTEDTGGDDGDTGAVVVGGDTDDEIPEGENYFGRASKQGAAPEGANPFAAASTAAPEDDWQTQIAEAKRMVEAQRIAREKEEAVEREREIAAAELKGKVYEGRRKPGDPVPEDPDATSTSAHGRVRKMLKARRPLGGDADFLKNPQPFGFAGNPDASAASFQTGSKPPEKTSKSPFAGFSLLGNSTDSTDPPRRTEMKPSILRRLSGAPAPFESTPEAAEIDADEGDEVRDVSSVPPNRATAAVTTTSRGSDLPEKRTAIFSAAIGPASASTDPAKPRVHRTPLAIELDL
jgi:hypothetical protein